MTYKEIVKDINERDVGMTATYCVITQRIQIIGKQSAGSRPRSFFVSLKRILQNKDLSVDDILKEATASIDGSS